MAKVNVSKIIKTAKAEIGTKATAVKKCKYNTWYYGSAVSGSCYDWCAVFVCWVFNKAGAMDMIPAKSAGCGVLASGFDRKGQFHISGYKAGDIVFFSWSGEPSTIVKGAKSLDHVGIIEKVNGDGTITTIEGNTGNSAYGEVMRRIRPISCVAGVARPAYIGTTNSGSNSNTSSSTRAYPVVTYKVKTGGKWLPAVTDLNDYAGIKGKAITDIAIKVSKGSVKYRVHIKGGSWLPYVTGYNTNDSNNGYAGNGKAIDAIEVYYTTPSDVKKSVGYLKAKYRVSALNNNYYNYQYDNEKSNNQDGYAGYFGKSIDRIQITLSK